MIAFTAPIVADIFSVFPLFYILPTYVLYIYQLYIMHFGHNPRIYSAPFFKLYSITCVILIIININVYFQGRILGAPMFLGLVEWLPHHGVLPTLILFCIYYFSFVGQFLTCVMSVNRFTVIKLGVNYMNFWRDHMIKVLIFVFGLPLGLTWSFFVTGVEIYIFDDNNLSMGYHLRETETLPYFDKGIFTAVIFMITCALSLFTNSYVLTYLLKTRHMDTGMSEDSPRNWGFFTYNMFTFCMEILTGIIQVLMYIIVYGDNCTDPTLYVCQIFIVDLLTLGPGWFMLLISEDLRKDITRRWYPTHMLNISIEPSHYNHPQFTTSARTTRVY